MSLQRVDKPSDSQDVSSLGEISVQAWGSVTLGPHSVEWLDVSAGKNLGLVLQGRKQVPFHKVAP